MHHHTETAGLLGVAGAHVAGVWALLLTPVVLWLLLSAARFVAQLGHEPAARLLARYRAIPVTARAAAWLMLTTAAVYLALAPSHRGEEPGTALLFVLNALLFVAASLATLRGRRRRWAMALCLATVVAYLVYGLALREEVDQLGMATKLVELTAFGLLALPGRPVLTLPSRKRWALVTTGFILLIMLTGIAAWGAQARAAQKESPTGAQDLVSGMVMQTVPNGPPTAAQIENAANFAEATRRGIARYEDVNVALADGYRPQLNEKDKTVHYANKKYEQDGRILDPEHPEALVYANTMHGPKLLGAVYEMPDLWDTGPDIGGALTPWHLHANICVGPYPGGWLTGIASPFGACPAGSLAITTPPMIHVWTYSRAEGPYGDLSDAEVATIVAG